MLLSLVELLLQALLMRLLELEQATPE
ncbi:MAG: hypothetical protein ACD_48C00588G0003, partial [uncultured bacterium]